MQKDFFAYLLGEVDAAVFILRITNLWLLNLFHLTIHWRHLTIFNIVWREIGLFMIVVLLEIYVFWSGFVLVWFEVNQTGSLEGRSHALDFTGRIIKILTNLMYKNLRTLTIRGKDLWSGHLGVLLLTQKSSWVVWELLLEERAGLWEVHVGLVEVGGDYDAVVDVSKPLQQLL